ncbi:MAG: hypothetical protein KGS45_06460 [Planctomycetes bacterium]|nr:hypothetical protein [Planctomycetota bacterium]
MVIAGISKRALIIVACGSAFVAASGHAFAQATGPREITGRARPEAATQGRATTYRLNALASHTFETKLKDGPGKSSVTRAAAGFGIGLPIAEASSLDFDVSSELSWYDWKDATGFVAGKDTPVRDTYDTSFSARFSTQLDDKWIGFVGADINSSAEWGADFGDSLTYGGVIGATYLASESFSIGIALAAQTRLEEDARFLPVPIFDWRINEQWRLGTSAGRSMRLSYAPSKTWLVFADVGFENSEYRLDNDGSTPDGVFRDTRVPVSLGVAYMPTERVTLSLLGGFNVYREFILDDKNGNRVHKDKSKPSPVLAALVRVSF